MDCFDLIYSVKDYFGCCFIVRFDLGGACRVRSWVVSWMVSSGGLDWSGGVDIASRGRA